MNYEAIANAALSRSDSIVTSLFPQGKRQGDEYVAINPKRPDKSLGSFSINLRTGKWGDFATGDSGGDLVSLLAYRDGCSQSEAAKRLADKLGVTGDNNTAKPDRDTWQPITPVPANAPSPPEKHPRYGKPAMRWLYRDEQEQPLFWVYRFEFPDTVKKEILPVTYGVGGWHFKGLAAPRPLYNLHLLALHPAAIVIVCEGEKAADAASQLLPLPEYVVTTSPNGSNAATKVNWKPLAGRRVVIWPDNDEPGKKYAEMAASLLPDSQVSIIDLEVFGTNKEGWDAADALVEGLNTDAVKAIITASLSKVEGNRKTSPSPYCIKRGQKGRRDGVYYNDGENDPLWICSPLEITARTHDGLGQGWGYLLEWIDPDGLHHSWPMPSELLAGQGDEYRRELLNGGLQISPGGKAKNHLTTYIQTACTEARARCTDRIGWHEGVFVLPSGTLGESSERVLYQASAIVKHAFKQRGQLDAWRRHIALPCKNNSRAVFAISCAFAPALLEAAGEESGGFHFRGESSSGKTTLLKLAASVWGSPEYLQRWRATTNGLEGLAQLHNDCLLILDELAQVDPKEAGEIAYMLGNGSGKTRSSREGFARKAARWRLLYLSAGEIGLADHVRLSGREVKAGQEIRLADIPADAGKGLGAFDQLHNCDNPAIFSRTLCDAAGKYYGTAGIAFMEYLIANIATLPEWISQHRRAFMQAIMPLAASGQVERVAARFALVSIAGELASHLDITGWEAGQAEDAAKTCFNAWLEARGGAGNLETKKLLSDMRAQLEAHSESRFSIIGDDGRPTINRMGFIRLLDGEREYIVLAEAFRRELCKGHDASKAAKTLLALGVLIPDSGGEPQRRESLPGLGRVRCYVLKASKLWEA